MKNSELTLKLIDTPEDNEVFICVSGFFHKITGIKIVGKKTILDVEGSIVCIDPDEWNFYQNKYPKSSLIKPIK